MAGIYVLIVILNIGAYASNDNSHIIMQDFSSIQNCNIAADIIRQKANRVKTVQCIKK